MRIVLFIFAILLSLPMTGQIRELDRLRQEQGSEQPPVDFDPDYQAILDEGVANSLVLPSPSEQVAQNAILEELKAQGVWDSLAVFLWFKGSGDLEFKRLNWKDPIIQPIAVGGTVTNNTTGLKGDGLTSVRIDYTIPGFMDPVSQAATVEVVVAQTGSFSSRILTQVGGTNGGNPLIMVNASDWQYIGSNPSISARANIDFSGTGVFGLTLTNGGERIEAWYDGVEDLGERETGKTTTGTIATGIYIFSSGTTSFDGELGFFAYGGAYDQAALLTAITINN